MFYNYVLQSVKNTKLYKGYTSDLKKRLKEHNQGLNKSTFLVAPTTTRQRKGSWYVHITHAEQDMFVCLHQIRAVDYRRFSSRLGQIDSDDFIKAKEGFLKLYK